MIILRQKEFISQQYYNKVRNRVQRRAFFRTLGDAAVGGAKNAGSQLIDAAIHPVRTTKAAGLGVGQKIKRSWVNLGATFGIGVGKEGERRKKEMKTSERTRNIIHFLSPGARKAINTHDIGVHALEKTGEGVVDSMARFKTEPIRYIGGKADEVARTGVLGAVGLSGAERAIGGRWIESTDIGNAISNSFNNTVLSPTAKSAISAAGKVTGYTTGERPGGLMEEIGRSVTAGKEKEIAAQKEAFKTTKQAKRAAQYWDRTVAPVTNKVAQADRKFWGKVSGAIDSAPGKIKHSAQTVLSGIGSVFGKKKSTPQPTTAGTY